MAPPTECGACGAIVPDGVAACTSCGRVLHRVLNPESGAYKITGFAPSIIIDGPDAQTGDAVVRVNDPAVYSEARLTPGGRVTLLVQGAGGVGRSGERSVNDSLRERLRSDGIDVSLSAGVDGRGEDGLLRSSASTFVVQMVTTPSAHEFWREASMGSATTNVDLLSAAGWLRSTLERKAAVIPPAQRATTLLAIDARHASVVGHKVVVDQYLEQHGDPANEYRFASVWIVGPTVRQTTKLGTGYP
jgi:hypothetical protein